MAQHTDIKYWKTETWYKPLIKRIKKAISILEKRDLASDDRFIKIYKRLKILPLEYGENNDINNHNYTKKGKLRKNSLFLTYKTTLNYPIDKDNKNLSTSFCNYEIHCKLINSGEKYMEKIKIEKIYLVA